MKVFLYVVVVLSLIISVLGDCYLHYPPGSNDRNQEANTDRNNGNRLFDSQNNGKGGYCTGPKLSYYEGSMLHVVWTNQHGCFGNPNVLCNLVLQYMCVDASSDLTNLIRDGSATTTNTIPDTPAGATTLDANSEPLYGLHENYAYYQACSMRQRNMGLFIADRESVGGLDPGERDARFTRQNNNGNRYGYECPEERDYYPYWAPTPWKDVAVFPSNIKYCSFYQSHSENVMARGYCTDTNGDGMTWNNQGDCTANGDTWYSGSSHGIPSPDCILLPLNQDNYLGLNSDGVFNTYPWIVPSSNIEPCITSSQGCNCVLRMRYNISSGALGINGNNPDSGFIDYTSNGANSPVQNNPTYTVNGQPLTLAMDTTQFGRTFQDRTHVFGILPRPSNLKGKIYNLNVKGKRGDIVQVYPAVEYDFTPRELTVLVQDHVHFQWTGCDQNPAGNAGEGTDQTDRSNIVQIPYSQDDEPVSDSWIAENPSKVLFTDSGTRLRMSYLDQEKSGQCLSYAQLAANNNNNQNQIDQDVQNCMKLNAASASFNGGAIQMNQVGTYNYMSTRNNSFSNRSQKAVIYVNNVLPVWGIVLVVIGTFIFISAGAIGAATLYSRSHPHSKVASLLQRFG